MLHFARNDLYHCSMQEIASGDLLRKIVGKLVPKYGHEADSLAMILIEDALGIPRTNIILNTTLSITPNIQTKLEEYINLLLRDVPIQHILGWGDFFGYKLKVNEHVLIPRQETEELVLLVSEIIFKKGYSSILDIGTGSGCIAIALALEDDSLSLSATDVSDSALEVAQLNAKMLGASIEFIKSDILKETPKKSFDAIISNPPYVLDSEKKILQANVLDHDPELALYVSDKKPLLFYERIVEVSKTILNQNGLLFFEINEKFGRETAELLIKYGYSDVSIKEDINGKDRFVYGFKN